MPSEEGVLRLIISIHTALAGCDGVLDQKIKHKKQISIHTALAGCDADYPPEIVDKMGFQSTQPSQAVTAQVLKGLRLTRISIHTALAGCDHWPHVHLPESESYFNPHSPRRL